MQQLSLEELKQIELDILKRFDAICRENNLQYSLAYGTMLGAVRHQGFIPWDDDIDVFMKREDYEKLLSLQYDDGRYEIKSYRYTKGYYYPFSKMIDAFTVLDEPWRADKNMGVYIDIFPLDTVQITDENEIAPILKKADALFNRAYHMGHKLSHHKSFSLRYIVKLLFLLLTYPFKRAVIGKAERFAMKDKSGNYRAMLVQISPAAFVESVYYDDVIDMPFEDGEFPVYKQYDYLLTKEYGDYMQLPPEEKRVSNHSFTAYRK